MEAPLSRAEAVTTPSVLPQEDGDARRRGLGDVPRRGARLQSGPGSRNSKGAVPPR
ncbi:hypothetical protein ACIRD4_16325 [Streptomyces clavifer]|uniref:hypothetical protein n=1 Tax=Streptomyces clavifer TaxID=68188 RepID=UPI003827E4E7